MKSTMLSDRLYELRTKKRMQQKVLADAIGVDAPVYSRIEKGDRKPRIEQLETLAKLLEVETEELHSLWIADKFVEVADDAPKETTKRAINLVRENL